MTEDEMVEWHHRFADYKQGSSKTAASSFFILIVNSRDVALAERPGV